MSPRYPDMPRRRLLLPGAAFACSVLGFAGQQWLQARSWWPDLPWLLMLQISAAFFAGVIYADLLNRRSQLRLWWGWYRAVFRPEFHAASNAEGTNNPYFSIHFLRNVQNSTIEMVVDQNIRDHLPVLVSKRPRGDYAKGEVLRIPVAVMPPNGTAYWGDDSQNAIIGQTNNMVEIRAVSNGRILQRYRVFIATGEGLYETGGRYFYLTQDQDVFDLNGSLI